MTRSLWTLAAALVFLAGCTRQPTRDAARSAADPALFEATGDGGVRELSGLDGQPLDVVTAHYGAPASDSRKTYQRDTGLLEQESGLAAALDTLRAGAGVEVRRLAWTGPNRAVWAVQRAGQWLVVDAVEWDDDVRF